jgi:integrase|tara:strand:+ start:827 stop:1831 length:1005 start_codon:yes stop_codon:yes gene_type:complete
MAFLTQDRGVYGIYERSKKKGKWRNVRILKLGNITKKEAQLQFTRWMDANQLNISSNVSFSVAISKFKNNLKIKIREGTLKENTLKLHFYFLDRYINKFFVINKINIRNVNYQAIEEFKRYMDQFDIKNRTINLSLNTLSLFLKYCVRMSIISNIPPIDRLKNIEKEIERLTLDECKILIAHSNENLSFYIQLLLFSGMRPFEANNLLWSDVNFPSKTIHIKSENKYKRGRKFYMHPELYALLIQYPNKKEYVSPYKKSDSTRSSFRALYKKTGINATSKIFRATFASIWAENGGPLDKLSLYLGNSPVVLKKYYANIEADSFKNDIHLMPSLS